MQQEYGGPADGLEVFEAVGADAVGRELVELGRRDPVLADGALANTARSLAETIDDPGTSATARAACAKALVDVLDRIRELAPEQVAGDALDDLGARREKRRARAAGA